MLDAVAGFIAEIVGSAISALADVASEAFTRRPLGCLLITMGAMVVLIAVVLLVVQAFR